MVLVYAKNSDLDAVADLKLSGEVGFRNPLYFDKPEKLSKGDEVHIIGDHPKVKKAYPDAKVHNNKQAKKQYPFHIGGGNFELSNGEKVKGKKEAIEAEKALNG